MTAETALIARNLDFVGDLYCRKYIDATDGWANSDLENNWWDGLKFYFDHAFMQNRAVETSQRLRDLTVSTLENRLCVNHDLERAYLDLCATVRENRLDSLLPPAQGESGGMYLSSVRLKKRTDRDMVRCVLTRIANHSAERNIYALIVSRLRQARDRTDELQRVHDFLKEFDGVGDKIAPFILQDVALICRDESLIPENLDALAFRFAFPIDTRIREVAPMLGCGWNDDSQIQQYFIDFSLNNSLYPPKCAAALWYLAYHSTDVLIEHCIKVTTLR